MFIKKNNMDASRTAGRAIRCNLFCRAALAKKYFRFYPLRAVKLSFFLILINLAVNNTFAEVIRVQISDSLEVSKEKPASIQLSYNDAVIVMLDKDTRFLRGIELEITAPSAWLSHQGSLAVALYSNAEKEPQKGTSDISVRQIRMDAIANKIQTVYQIPIRRNHNMRDSPYAALISNVRKEDFPLIVRLMPIVRDVSEDVQNMRFNLTVKPILSDEGAVKINVRYPLALQNKAYTVLIDDKVIERAEDEHFYSEGEHHLMLISNDYRNESRRFIIERGKTLELNITLQDLTPLIIFEAPDNAKIFLDNIRFPNAQSPRPVEPGPHEVKIQVSDYTIIKSIYIHKGKTYRIAYTIDLDISEED
jgi:hypothetical protein